MTLFAANSGEASSDNDVQEKRRAQPPATKQSGKAEQKSYSRSDSADETPARSTIASFLRVLVLASRARAGIGLRHERFWSARCGCQPTCSSSHSQFRSNFGSRDLPNDLSDCSSDRFLLDRSQKVPSKRFFGRHQGRIRSGCRGIQSRGRRIHRNLVPGAFHPPLICFAGTPSSRYWKSLARPRVSSNWPSGQTKVPAAKPERMRVLYAPRLALGRDRL